MPTNDAKPLTGTSAVWPVHFSQESVSVMSREPGELLRVVCWTWLRDGEETDGEVRATATLDDGTTVGGTLLGDVTVDDEDIPGARRSASRLARPARTSRSGSVVRPPARASRPSLRRT